MYTFFRSAKTNTLLEDHPSPSGPSRFGHTVFQTRAAITTAFEALHKLQNAIRVRCQIGCACMCHTLPCYRRHARCDSEWPESLNFLQGNHPSLAHALGTPNGWIQTKRKNKTQRPKLTEVKAHKCTSVAKSNVNANVLGIVEGDIHYCLGLYHLV